MRPLIVIGSALTAAVLTFIAAVIGRIVAVNQDSELHGVAARSLLVVIALGLTAIFWWLRMTPRDRPEALLLGLLGGWLLNPSSWTGASYAGRFFTSYGLGSFVIDLVLWAMTSMAILTVLDRTSTTASR
ncbi:MAG: hypothetical protein QOJ72_2059 [Nocardioidaceae bacterium]|jgi:hypothetical protein|nr:hypothetical protein [Nocardioidaceae bacterium]